MGRFIQDGTGVVVSVSDDKDHRFASGWKPIVEEKPSTGRRSAKKNDES